MSEKISSSSQGSGMSSIEKLALGLGSVVSFIVVVSTIWYAAVAATDLTHAVNDANKNIHKMYTIIEKKEEADKILLNRVDALTIKQESLASTKPSLVHLDKKYAVMEAPDGAVFMLTVYAEDEEL